MEKGPVWTSPYEEFFCMKVILLQDVDGLGKAGDLKEVAMAMLATIFYPDAWRLARHQHSLPIANNA